MKTKDEKYRELVLATLRQSEELDRLRKKIAAEEMLKICKRRSKHESQGITPPDLKDGLGE